MAVSKRLRFEILKRHNFRCVYCGASPLQNSLTIKLHADHVEPESKGGETDAMNLVAACVDCNLGKSNVRLEDRRLRSSFTSDEDREHAEQIREYLAVQRDVAAAKRDAEALVLEHWQDRIGDFPRDLPKYIPSAIRDFGINGAIDAVDAVARKGIGNSSGQIKYFCGVLRAWRKPKEAVTPPTATSAEINTACWQIAIQYIETYCRYRWSTEDRLGLGDLIQSAIGSSKSKPAAMSLEDLYRAVDNAAWLETPDFENPGVAEKMRFVKEVTNTISGHSDVVDETFVCYTIDDFYREAALNAVYGIDTIWSDHCTCSITGELRDTFTDIIEAIGVGYLYKAIKHCGAVDPESPAQEQVTRLRRFVVDDITGSSFPRHLEISKWDEWKHLETKAEAE